MKSQTKPNHDFQLHAICNAPVSLHKIVSDIQLILLPLAVERKSIIINDIDRAISVFADEESLAFVMGSLISNALFSTTDCCIRIESSCDEQGIQVKIRNNGEFSYNSRMCSLSRMTEAIQKLSASINIYREADPGLTVVLSIAGRKAA